MQIFEVGPRKTIRQNQIKTPIKQRNTQKMINEKKDLGSIQKKEQKPKRKRRKAKAKATPIWAFKTRKASKTKAKKRESTNEDEKGGAIKPLKRIIQKSQKGVRQLKYLEKNKLIQENVQKVRTRGTHSLKHRTFNTLDFSKFFDQPKEILKIEQQISEQNQSPSIIERHEEQIVRKPEKQKQQKQKKSEKYKQKLQRKNQRIAELQRKNKELQTKLIKSLEQRVKDMQKIIKEQNQQLKYRFNMNILGVNDSLIKIQ